jgi:hypothetical protein
MKKLNWSVPAIDSILSVFFIAKIINDSLADKYIFLDVFVFNLLMALGLSTLLICMWIYWYASNTGKCLRLWKIIRNIGIGFVLSSFAWYVISKIFDLSYMIKLQVPLD